MSEFEIKELDEWIDAFTDETKPFNIKMALSCAGLYIPLQKLVREKFGDGFTYQVLIGEHPDFNRETPKQRLIALCNAVLRLQTD